MNRKQIVVLWLGVALILAGLTAPPWRAHYVSSSYSGARYSGDRSLGSSTDRFEDIGRHLSGRAGITETLSQTGKIVSPAIPETFARVVPGNISPTTLGITDQVFVTDASLLRGLNAGQIAEGLEIPASSSFRIIEFPSQGVNGIAVPIRNPSPGFIGNGFTSGGLPEFTIPNGPIPAGAVVRTVP